MSQAAYYNGYDDGFEDGKRAGLKEAGSASAPSSPRVPSGAGGSSSGPAPTVDGVLVPKGTSTTLSVNREVGLDSEGLLDVSNVAANNLCVKVDFGPDVFDESTKFQIKLPSYITSCIFGITTEADLFINKWVVQDVPASHVVDIPDSEGLWQVGATFAVSRVSDTTAFVLVYGF